MDRFTQFAPPSPAAAKRGFFARLFGFGSSEEEESPKPSPKPTPSPPPPAAAAAAAKVSISPKLTTASKDQRAQTLPAQTTLEPAKPPSPVLSQAAPTSSAANRAERSPVKPHQDPLSQQQQQQQQPFLSSPLPDRPEAAMKKIKQRQLDHRTKDFWMDDNKASMCYECDTPFGMLVRRHHCRTCGQIFCSKCTRKPGPGEIPGYDGTIRVCHFCYNILQNPVLADDIGKIIDTASTAAESSRANGNASDSDDPEAAEEELVSNTYERVSFTPAPRSTDSPTKVTKTHRRTPSELSQPDLNDIAAAEASAAALASWKEDDQEGEDSDALERQRHGQYDSLESTAIPSAMVAANEPKSDVDLRPPQPDVGNADEPLKPENDAISRLKMQSAIRRKASLQAFAVPQVTPEKAPKASGESSGGTNGASNGSSGMFVPKSTEANASSAAAAAAAASDSLNREAKLHLERLCSYLIHHHGLNPCWQPVILQLAKQACDSLRPQWRIGDRIDIRNYVKIKKLPGGSMEDCTYIDGLVFTKNRVQKSMKTDIQSARVLLLGCSIEFERKSDRMVSFDKLLVQEQDYMRMLISKIAAMQPDLILVEKSVSRVAQNLLTEAGICLALNVKSHVIQQIARITHSTVLMSTEHVLAANLGVIGHFKIETYSGPWGHKPCMYIAGCPRHLFATLVIRGAPDAVLSRVKTILSFMTSATWNVKLENCLLLDEFAAVKPNSASLRDPLAPMSTSWSVLIPSEVLKKNRRKQSKSLSRSSDSDTQSTSSDEADANSNNPAAELSQFLVGPTLLRTPLLPELSLSSTGLSSNRDGVEDRSAHLALNFSYRSLLQPNPVATARSAGRSLDASGETSPLTSSSHDSKLADKFTFGESSSSHKYEKLLDQHFIYLHSLFCTATSAQCTPFEWQIINYYSSNDLTLGQFLDTFCFSLRMKCGIAECHRPLIDHERCFMHNNGRLNVAVRPWPQNMPNPVSSTAGDSKAVYTWAYCRNQARQTPYMVPVSAEALTMSFGKYLELFFYSERTQCRSCNQHLYREHIRYFYFDNKVVIFAYEPVKALDVAVPPMRMRFDDRDHGAILDQELEEIIYLSQRIHERVMSKLTELDDAYFPTDSEERKELQEFRKLQEKEKISFLEKIQREQELINSNQTNVFQLTALRRYLYGNVKTWNSMIVEHEMRYQKKRQSFIMNSTTRKDAQPSSPHLASPPPTPALVHDPQALASAVAFASIGTAANAVVATASVSNEGMDSSTEISPPSSDGTTPVEQPLRSSEDELPTQDAPLQPSISIAPAPDAPVAPESSQPVSSNPLAASSEQISDSSLHPLSAPSSTAATPTALSPPSSTQTSTASSPALSHAGKDKKAGFLDAFSAFSEILPSKPKSAITDVMENSKVHIFTTGSAQQSCVAIYENEPSSIISFALNSEEYESELKKFQPSRPAPTFMEEAFRAITSTNNTTISNKWRSSSVWGGPKIAVSCTSYFAHQFHWLRRLVGLNEEKFTLSLSRCRSLAVRGGKSGSRFCKTMDGRFILKAIQPVELQGFLAFAPLYFDYFSKVFFQQVPTAIAKTVGIYSVYIKTARKEEKLDFIVMENLFYGHKIEKTFDLKGSLRSRYTESKGATDRDVVFMDENLLELMYTDPICVSNEAKALLGMTVWNDTLCLASLNVMDYSLVVGVDEEKNQLVVGIIDYMRTYTWDKQLETWVKQTMSNTKKPTIISPKLYKKRFRNAIWNYFILLPSVATSVQNGYFPGL